MANKITLEVSLDLAPANGPNVIVTGNPANANGKNVRWIESDENQIPFFFAGIDLDQTEFPVQRILVNKKRMICKNKGTMAEFDYVVWVRHNGILYNSTDPDGGPAGGKAVIRNQ